MATEIFKASRWTRGNSLFPTYIEVTDKSITRRKRCWFRLDEMTSSISKIACVEIKTGLVWSEIIIIESSGGTAALTSHGHTKATPAVSSNSSKKSRPSRRFQTKKKNSAQFLWRRRFAGDDVRSRCSDATRRNE